MTATGLNPALLKIRGSKSNSTATARPIGFRLAWKALQFLISKVKVKHSAPHSLLKFKNLKVRASQFTNQLSILPRFCTALLEPA